MTVLILPCISKILKRGYVLRYTVVNRNWANNLQNAVQSTTTRTNKILPKKIHDVNTNVVNDVVLFKYENPKFYSYMNFFAIIQYIFWMYLGKFAFTALKDAPVDHSKITEDTPWFRRINLGENKYRNTLGVIAVLVGTGSLSLVWMYTLKSVRYLILNKGGKHITFVTYAPFGKNRIMRVPIEYVDCKESRALAKVQLPLKVKNTWFHYMLDMKGEFKQPTLFDCTAGLTRKF